MPFKPLDQRTVVTSSGGGFKPLTEEEATLGLEDVEPLRREDVSRETSGPGPGSTIAGAIRDALKALLPAAGGVMDQPTDRELAIASQPATGLVRTPAGRQFTGTPDTRPVVPPAPEPRPAPVIGPPSRSPITGEASFVPFNPGASIADVAREISGGVGRGFKQIGRQWVGGALGVPAALVTGDRSGVEGAKLAIKEGEADTRSAQARSMLEGGDPAAALQAAEGVGPLAAYMGAFSSRAPLTAAIMFGQPEAAEKYRHFVQLGNSPLAALAMSQAANATEAFTEKLGWNFLTKLFKVPANAPKAEFLRALGIQQFGEHAEEQINLLANFGISRLANDPDATPEKLWQEMKNTAAVTQYLNTALGGAAGGWRGAARGVRKLEERFLPERSIARELRDVLEAGPVRDTPQTERRITIQGESRAPDTRVRGVDAGSVQELPQIELSLADRLASILADDQETDAETPLPRLNEREARGRYPAIEIPDEEVGREPAAPQPSLAEALRRELENRARAEPGAVEPEQIFERGPERQDAAPPVREDERFAFAQGTYREGRGGDITSIERRRYNNAAEARALREKLSETEGRAERKELMRRIEELESPRLALSQVVHGPREPRRTQPDDPFGGFRQATGKYPWEMSFPEFFKHTASRLKKAYPQRDDRWIQSALRQQYDEAREYGLRTQGRKAFAMQDMEEGLTVPMEEVRQSVKALVAAAEEKQPQFEALLNSIGEEVDAFVLVGPVKKEDRALAKIIGKYKGDVQRIGDMNRGTLVVDSPQMVGAVVQRLAREPIKKPPENRFETGPLPTGYMDAAVVLDIGHAAEVQINTPEMMAAKALGHIAYKAQTDLEREILSQGRGYTEQEKRVIDALEARQREIYGQAVLDMNRRIARGERLNRARMKDIANRYSEEDLEAERRRIATLLSNSGLSMRTSEPVEEGPDIRRGGSSSQASATPESRSIVTGMSPNSQYLMSTGDTVSRLPGETGSTEQESENVQTDRPAFAQRVRSDRATKGDTGPVAQTGRGGRDNPQNGKRPSDPVATAGRARELHERYPDKESRLGRCHELTWQKVVYSPGDSYRHVIGVTSSPVGLKIWHSVAQDPETGNIWEPIANLWYTPEVMTEAFGYEPVVSLSAEETREHALREGVYTDQTVVKPKGWNHTFMLPGEQYEPDPSIFQRDRPALASADMGDGFYSALYKAVENLPLKSAPIAQWRATIGNLKGVKKAEIELSGIDDWLATMGEGAKEPMAKSVVLEALQQGLFKIENTELGGEDSEFDEDEWSDRVSERAWEIWSDQLHEDLSKEMPDKPTITVENVMGGQLDIFTGEEQQGGWVATITLGAPGQVDEFRRGRGDSGRYGRRRYYWNFDADHEEFNDADPDYERPEHDDEIGEGRSFSLPPEATEEAARAKAQDLINDWWNDEWQLRAEYADSDGAPDWAYEQAQREIPREDEESTHYQQYSLPGGDEDYREFFVTAPRVKAVPRESSNTGWRRAQWKDGHSGYEDIVNPIVRVRFNTRRDANGARVLFIEEIQPPAAGARTFDAMPEFAQKNWASIGLKRMVNYAIENDYDAIAWTNGIDQAERYNLARHANEVIVRHHEGKFDIDVLDTNNRMHRDVATGLTEETLADHIGKEAAAKAIAEVGGVDTEGSVVLKPERDIKVSSSSLVPLYDKVLPAAANNVLKQIGVRDRVDKILLPIAKTGGRTDAARPRPFDAFLISDELKGAVKKAGGVPFLQGDSGVVYNPLHVAPGAPSGFKPIDPRMAGFDSPRERRGIFLPETGHSRTINAIAAHLNERGLTKGLLDGIEGYVVYNDEFNRHAALYWPDLNVIGFNEARLREYLNTPNGRGMVAFFIAHEVTHAIDRASRDSMLTFMSPALDFDFDNTGAGTVMTSNSPLVQEIFRVMVNGPADLREFFRYPMEHLSSGNMSMEIGKSEMLAQVGALYVNNPGTVLRHLPSWYRLMESVYGTPPEVSKATSRNVVAAPKSTGEAHERLQKALERASSDQRTPEPIVARNERSGDREADRPGSPRGPPGPGVGEGAGSGALAAEGPGAVRGDGGSRRALAAQAPNPHWDIDEPGLRDRLLREWQNNKIDLKKTQEAIEKFAGYGVIPEAGDAYLAEERYHGRVSALIRKFTRDTVKPLLEEIKDSAVTIDEVGEYLWARHAAERNAQMLKINPGGPDNLSGMSDADAQAKIQAFRAAGKTPALQRIAHRVDQITKATRQLIVREGLESQATIDAWENVYKNYVPLFRDDDTAGTGQGFTIKGPESKRAMGSQRAARAILAAVIAQHEKAIVRAEKANVGRSLIKLAEQFPNPDFWKVDTPPMKRSINPTTGLVQVGVDPLYRNRDDVFIVKEKQGDQVVERVLTFNQNRERAAALVASMKNLDVVQLDGMTKAVGKVTRLMANLATSWNPIFWATNFARDVQTAAVNLQSTPLQGRAPAVISNIPNAIKGIADAEFRNGTSTWARWYREFEEEGGKTGWMKIWDDLKDRQKELADEIKASQRGKANPLKWGALALDVIDKTNSAIENATRLSAYVEARNMGLSKAKAASLAKNLTVNFNRKGNRSSATNAWYMFFNASVQGNARLIQAVAKSRKAQAMVGVMVAIGAALELVNRVLGGEDDDENINWELIPEHIKQRNLILMLPDGKRASIPMPYGFNIFFNAGRMMMETVLAAGSDMVTEKKRPLEQAWNFAEVLIDSFMPFGQSSSVPQLISPSVLDPFVQHSENRTWYGAPMRPEQSQYGPAKPDHQLYFRTTSDTAKDLARWLSDATGGDEIRGGAIDISPTTLTHVFSTITGGPGRFGLGMFDFSRHIVGRVTGESEPEDLPWQRVPFVGTFFGEITDRERAAKYYRLRPQAMQAQKEIRAYRKEGSEDKAGAREDAEPGLAAMAREITKREFQRDMKGLREEFKDIESLPASERQRLRRKMQAEETLVMSRALREYNEAQKGAR